jgi:hypothetical protein
MDNSRGTAAWVMLGCVAVIAAIAGYLGWHQSPKEAIPTTTVSAASANTLAATSYSEVYVVSQPGQRITFHVLYQAPDKLSYYSDSQNQRRYVIFAGSTQYVSQAVSSGSTHVVLHYCKVGVQPSEQDPAQLYLSPSNISRTPLQYTYTGGVYTFAVPTTQGPVAPAFYRVEGPYITQFGAKTSAESWQLALTDINHAPPVTVPAHVTKLCTNSDLSGR